MRGYKVGSDDPIYYRTTIELPKELQSVDESLLFHTLFIWAERYDLYLNGIWVESGGQEAVGVTLPRQLLEASKQLTIAIRVNPGRLSYQGVSNYGRVLIGPKSTIQPLLADSFHIQYTFPLLFLLPRIAFSALFCFLFLFLSKNREHFAFILFAFAGVLKFIVRMDFSQRYLPTGADGLWAYQMIYPLEQAFLILFIQRYFRKESRAFDRTLGATILFLIGLGAYGLIQGPGELNRDLMHHLPRLIKMSAMFYGVYLATETMLYLAWSRRSQVRLTSATVLAIFFMAGLGASIIDISGILPRDMRGFMTYSVELVMFIILAALTALDVRSLTDQRQATSDTLNKMVDPRVAETLMQTRGRMKPQRLDLAVMFSDIRSFTAISEKVPAEDVVSFLNEYFPHAVACIQNHNGTIDKFIGDCVMAIWGAPRPDPDAVLNAAWAALDLRKAVATFNTERRQQGNFEIRIGVGLHCGPAVVGEIGSHDRTQYTAVGDTINTASRLETMTKETGIDIIVSEAVVEQIRDKALVALVDSAATIRGRESPIAIYQLLGLLDKTGSIITHSLEIDARIGRQAKPGVIEQVIALDTTAAIKPVA